MMEHNVLKHDYQKLTEMRVAFCQKWRRCPALSGGAIKPLPTPGQLSLLGVPLDLLGVPLGLLGVPLGLLGLPPGL